MKNLLHIFGHWRVQAHTHEDFLHADVVVAHEFGDQKVPSRATIDIIHTALLICTKYGIPLLCQFPSNVIAERNGVKPLHIVRTHLLKPGTYVDTEEANRQFAQECAKRGWTVAAVCTHPHHAWRAGKNLERHGIAAVFPDLSRIGYDKECARAAMRTAGLFIPREIRARLWYALRGWM